MQRGNLIEQAVIAGSLVRGFLGQFRMRKKAEDAEAIIGADDDDAFFGEILTVVASFGIAAGDEAAAIEPDDDRKLGWRGMRGNPDGEIQAIFAGLNVTKVDVAVHVGLHAGGAEFIGGADSLPAQRGLRRFPAEFADGRSGEGDAFEHAHGAVGIESAGDDATFGFDFVLCRGWPVSVTIASDSAVSVAKNIIFASWGISWTPAIAN